MQHACVIYGQQSLSSQHQHAMLKILVVSSGCLLSRFSHILLQLFIAAPCCSLSMLASGTVLSKQQL
jgi:hypothetical protein